MFDSLLALRVVDGSIVQVPLTADGSPGASSTFVEDAGPSPDGIVVQDGVVYCTTMGVPSEVSGLSGEESLDFSARNGGLSAAALSDGSPFAVLETGALTTGKQLCSDGAGRLYWGDREGRRVSSVRVDGTDLQDLVINSPDGSKDEECVGVAVDSESGYVYWTQKGSEQGGDGRILRAGLTMPPGEDARTRSDVEVLWEGLPKPIDLEIYQGTLYWTDRGIEPLSSTLNRAPLPAAGSKGATPEVVARGFQESIGLEIDGDAGVAYVSDLGGRILAVGIEGTEPIEGAEPSAASPRVVVDLGTPISGLVGLNNTHKS